MTTGEMLYLSLAIGAVILFIAVLSYHDQQQRKDQR